MVIDLKATLGEPAFDAVDYVLDGAGAEGIEARSAALAAAGGPPQDRVERWCQAIAPLIALVVSRRPSPRPGELAALLAYAKA